MLPLMPGYLPEERRRELVMVLQLKRLPLNKHWGFLITFGSVLHCLQLLDLGLLYFCKTQEISRHCSVKVTVCLYHWAALMTRTSRCLLPWMDSGEIKFFDLLQSLSKQWYNILSFVTCKFWAYFHKDSSSLPLRLRASIKPPNKGNQKLFTAYLVLQNSLPKFCWNPVDVECCHGKPLFSTAHRSATGTATEELRPWKQKCQDTLTIGICGCLLLILPG